MTALPAAFLNRPLAHRGLHNVSDGRPENSRAAIEAAISAGYGIEIDLQLSRDHQAMVFHDYDLQRLTGTAGPIRQKDARALGELQLLGGADGVPGLPEVLDLVAGRAPLLIEIKDQDGIMGPNIGALEDACVTALKGYSGPVAIMSFNPHSVMEIGRLAPDLPRGLVTSAYDPDDWAPLAPSVCDHLRGIPDFTRSGASFISHEVEDLARQRVRDLGRQGADILCWTVRSAEQEAQARQIADNITFEGYLPAVAG